MKDENDDGKLSSEEMVNLMVMILKEVRAVNRRLDLIFKRYKHDK